MEILFTAFNGKNNSSKILLDNINSDNKLYLKNSFDTSVKALIKELKRKQYDLIISFGQAPLDIDTIKIETTGKVNIEYKTRYDYIELKNKLNKYYKTIISDNAGTYLCNNLYFHGLIYINDNKLNTNMIFIHIPKLNCISNIETLSNIFDSLYIK